MTTILQKLKVLHMQSASRGELNKLACKGLPDGTLVMTSRCAGMFTRYTFRKIPSTAKKAIE